MIRGGLCIVLLGCGNHDAPAPQTRVRDDATRAAVVAPAIDAAPAPIQNIEPGDPPVSMVVVTSEPRFYIDRTEVTVGAYRECVEAKACTPPKDPAWTSWGPKRAVAFVSAEQAWDYCRYRGSRLPTSKEWLRAALGSDGRKYPWGNGAPSCKVAVLANCSKGAISDVGTKPQGASPYGALDMAGNVNEYINDDPTGARDHLDVAVSGGDVGTMPAELASVFDQHSGYAAAHEITGIRCARTPK